MSMSHSPDMEDRLLCLEAAIASVTTVIAIIREDMSSNSAALKNITTFFTKCEQVITYEPSVQQPSGLSQSVSPVHDDNHVRLKTRKVIVDLYAAATGTTTATIDNTEPIEHNRA